ncbi:hypothetical protein [Trueperella bialowiezensis]|uniref:Uncharacterized protein n=1 Tax=Trueperella bialowiezensis TaxID=312285 RepID=A0A448PE65_9ACTO|nr:hypothetical protein [Trueperella bialowiezensis]VEI13222.1 Uncharacterised protein [Trueperella bialowiezensis]
MDETTKPDRQTDEAEKNDSQVQESASTDTHPAQETDWKAQARKWEERAKANKTRADQLKKELDDANNASTDLDKALARISKLEDHNKQLQHSALVAEVAAAKNVDASLLSGTTRKELEAHADRLLAWRGSGAASAAAPNLGGQPSNQPEPDATRKLVRELFNKE